MVLRDTTGTGADTGVDRTKQFDVEQLLLLEAVDAKAQLFIARARLLPFVHRAHLQGEERRRNAR